MLGPEGARGVGKVTTGAAAVAVGAGAVATGALLAEADVKFLAGASAGGPNVRTHDPSAALHRKCTVGSTAGSTSILGVAVVAVVAVGVVLGGRNAETPISPFLLLL